MTQGQFQERFEVAASRGYHQFAALECDEANGHLLRGTAPDGNIDGHQFAAVHDSHQSFPAAAGHRFISGGQHGRPIQAIGSPFQLVNAHSCAAGSLQGEPRVWFEPDEV